MQINFLEFSLLKFFPKCHAKPNLFQLFKQNKNRFLRLIKFDFPEAQFQYALSGSPDKFNKSKRNNKAINGHEKNPFEKFFSGTAEWGGAGR
jgi:hypothetical protein